MILDVQTYKFGHGWRATSIYCVFDFFTVVELLGPVELFNQSGRQLNSFDFVAKRAPDIFIVLAEKFPKELKVQMESWNKTKDQFLNSVNSGTYEHAGRYKNFFETLFHQILMFRKSFCNQIHTLAQLKKDTKKV